MDPHTGRHRAKGLGARRRARDLDNAAKVKSLAPYEPRHGGGVPRVRTVG